MLLQSLHCSLIRIQINHLFVNLIYLIKSALIQNNLIAIFCEPFYKEGKNFYTWTIPVGTNNDKNGHSWVGEAYLLPCGLTCWFLVFFQMKLGKLANHFQKWLNAIKLMNYFFPLRLNFLHDKKMLFSKDHGQFMFGK